MARSPFKKKKTAKTTPAKSKKPYEIDGFIFSTKGAKDLYTLLTKHLKDGLIHQFKLPQINEEKKNKFGSKKCQINDIVFDSMLEGRFFLYLLTLHEQKIVSCIVTHPKFQLQKSFKKYGKTIRAIEYFADFQVTYADGTEIIYDTKGRETADFKIKQKMFNYRYPDLTLVCVKDEKGNWINKTTKEALPFGNRKL